MALSNEIFSRERLAGYDPERMGRSVVLVIGAGALGQNTAQNLALAGIGELRIVDRDSFEEHNRTRSPSYPLPEEQERYGMEKARAVAAKLRRLMTAPNPSMRYAHDWIQTLGDGAFKGVSAVVSCVDSPLARAYLSDKARQHGLPFIEGGFEAANITMTCFPAAHGTQEARTAPCWRCSHQDIRGTFSCRFYAARAEAAGIIPAVQNAAAVLGGLQAEAAILALHTDLDAPSNARAFDLNIRTGRSRTVKLATDPRCPGVHLAFDADPIPLQTTADNTVEQLLREMSAHVGSAARLILPLKLFAKLIWNESCTECGKRAAVHAPEWSWIMTPRCEECDGPFPVSNTASPGSPDVYPELTLESNPEVLRATCRQIGLPPLSLVRATGEDSASALFELGGSLSELYESGDLL
ncbi:MAG TPA: ThiF family adenylyltransferase [Pyrinomonadaceae bacterium]|jgi:molybdopterin/thiamine biosynthesis adenylyltransferase|nr:ThiF family adenylyltransferase [Pyrinomonadaceae bacterium]